REIRGIEVRDAADAAAPFAQHFPHGIDGFPHRSNDPDSGHDDAASHDSIPLKINSRRSLPAARRSTIRSGGSAAARAADVEDAEEFHGEDEILLIDRFGPGLQVSEDDFGFGDEALTDVGDAFDNAAVLAGVEQFRGVDERISRCGPTVERELGNLREDDDMLELRRLAQ